MKKSVLYPGFVSAMLVPPDMANLSAAIGTDSGLGRKISTAQIYTPGGHLAPKH
jgi:hypothetical protein